MSEAGNESRSIATRPSSRAGRVVEGERPRDAQRLGARRRDLDHPGDDPDVGSRDGANAHLNACRPPHAQHQMIRHDEEPERLRVAARDGADRQQPGAGSRRCARRASGWRASGLPARCRSRASSAAPRPLRPPMHRAGTCRRRRRSQARGPAARSRRAGCRATARPGLDASGRAAQLRRRPSQPPRSCRSRFIERRAVRGSAGHRRRERDAGRGDIRLDAAVEGKPERGEDRDPAAGLVDRRPECFAPIAMPTSSPARCAASNSTAAAVGTTTTGTVSVLGDAQRPGRERRAVEHDGSRPACDAAIAAACGSAPACTTRPARRRCSTLWR